MTEISAKSPNGNTRDQIIASIRHNLAVSAPFDAVRKAHHGNHTEFSTLESVVTSDSVLNNFKASLDLLGAYFKLADSEIAVASHVEKIIAKLGAKRIAISDSGVVKRATASITGMEFLANASKDVLFNCDLGITSAQWAIAETGTLVLESERENHRLTSLVPTVHLCILKASGIRQTMGEILELTSKNLSRTITFITGASRTSDIELTLAIGVHGPAELYVVVIADE